MHSSFCWVCILFLRYVGTKKIENYYSKSCEGCSFPPPPHLLLQSQEIRPIFFYVMSVYSSVLPKIPLLLWLVPYWLFLAFCHFNLGTTVSLPYIHWYCDIILHIMSGSWKHSIECYLTSQLYFSLISVFLWYLTLLSLMLLFLWFKNDSISDHISLIPICASFSFL